MTSAIFEGNSPFATALREARSARSLSVANVAKSLMLSEDQVAGLEADNLGAFYGASYAERAAQRYAEFLGVDASLEGAPHSPVAEPAAVEAPAVAPRRETAIKLRGNSFLSSPSVRWSLAGALAVLGIVFVGVKFLGSRAPTPPVSQVQEPLPVPVEAAPAVETQPTESQTESPVVEPVATEAATLPPSPQPQPIATDVSSVPDDPEHRFFLVVTRNVTIRATDVNGTVLLSGPQRASEGRRVVGEPPFDIQVSNEDAVEIYYRGQRIRPGANTYDGITATVVR